MMACSLFILFLPSDFAFKLVACPWAPLEYYGLGLVVLIADEEAANSKLAMGSFLSVNLKTLASTDSSGE